MVNRHNQKLVVTVEEVDGAKGLAFIVHGLGGFKEQIHIKEMAKAFQDEGFTTVSYDAANTIGESDGKMEEATLTNYFEDLEDVVSWAKTQPWFTSPFIVSGHSLGGACSIMYSAKYPDEVMAIAPICPFIAGELYEAHHDPAIMEQWETQGFTLSPSQSKPGTMKKLKWSLVEDLRRQDMRLIAAKVTCPCLFVAGSKDHGIPPSDIRQASDKVQGQVTFHVIEGMEHNPRSEEHLEELGQLIRNWARKLV